MTILMKQVYYVFVLIKCYLLPNSSLKLKIENNLIYSITVLYNMKQITFY